MSSKVSLRGPNALLVSSADDQQTTASIDGVMQLNELVVARDAVVHDELHAHDPCKIAREIPDISRFLIKKTDTGTIFFLPEKSEFCLPELTAETPPLYYEFVGTNLKHFLLDAGAAVFHDSSYVLSGSSLRRPSAADNQVFDLKNTGVEQLRLTVRTARDHDGVFYRVTGSFSSTSRPCARRESCACEESRACGESCSCGESRPDGCACDPCDCDPCGC